MAASTASSAEMITQLESARKLALNDPQVYTQVVPGILPLIGPSAALDIRRWGADFIAECFASPSLPNAQKEQLVSDVLPSLLGFLENPAEDTAVLRSVVQTATSLYALVFKRMYVGYLPV
jgi:symplekin